MAGKAGVAYNKLLYGDLKKNYRVLSIHPAIWISRPSLSIVLSIYSFKMVAHLASKGGLGIFMEYSHCIHGSYP